MSVPLYNDYQITMLRRRAQHYLSHDTAICAGLNNLAELTQFSVGALTLSNDQLHALALRMRYYPMEAA